MHPRANRNPPSRVGDVVISRYSLWQNCYSSSLAFTMEGFRMLRAATVIEIALL